MIAKSPDFVPAPAPRRLADARCKTVVDCYTFFDKVFPECGLIDYTEGIYHGDPQVPYEVAQQNQIDYVLDEVDCGPGARILEIGCGNGRLLETAERRGAHAIGITISPEQVDFCRRRSLSAYLINYENLGPEWNQRFDAVVANGPIEHFVQAQDAAEGRTDDIYRHMFAICHRLIDPESPIGKFMNTTIHFLREPDPRDLQKSPWRFPYGSDPFHYSMLNHSFGGWYPTPGQLKRCAAGFFELVKQVDGTQDYHWTSEEWLRRIQSQALRARHFPKVFARSLPFVLRSPRQALTMLYCMLISQSWNWQFRGANPPTQLLRQTWKVADTP
jgi:cyclopropane fatty-acyl-phospholipid synthase-like methyltransferase